MENRIKSYEQFIKKELKRDLSPSEREKLAKYHKEMVENFQHERLVHLLIMLFFISVSLALIWILLDFMFTTYEISLETILFTALTLLVSGLSVAYVRHYYFLENHIQKLYDVSSSLYKK